MALIEASWWLLTVDWKQLEAALIPALVLKLDYPAHLVSYICSLDLGNICARITVALDQPTDRIVLGMLYENMGIYDITVRQHEYI